MSILSNSQTKLKTLNQKIISTKTKRLLNLIMSIPYTTKLKQVSTIINYTINSNTFSFVIEDDVSSISSDIESIYDNSSSSSEDSHCSGRTNKTVRYDPKTQMFYLIPRVVSHDLSQSSGDDCDSQVSNKTLKRYLKQKNIKEQ